MSDSDSEPGSPPEPAPRSVPARDSLEGPEAGLTAASPGRITLLAVPMVAFTICTYVGNALAPTLATDTPLLLLVLSPKLRWLFLVSPKVDAIWFFAIPLARATVFLAVYYLLGYWYGDRALRWLESRSPNALRPVLWIERKFHAGRVPITMLFPSNISAMLAGADRMPIPVFFGAALGSVALRIWAVRSLADAFRGTLLNVLDWVSVNQLWLTALSVGSVIAWVAWSNRHGVRRDETIEEIIEDFEPDGALE